MNNRRGFSLIEMVAVLSASTILFGIATGLLILLMQVDRSWREQVRGHATVASLADQFRRDVHGAERLTSLAALAGKAGPGWRFQSAPGRVVEYRATPGHLLRTQLVEGKTVQQEDFRLPGNASVSVQPPNAAAGLVMLRISPPQKPVDLSAHGPLEIAATLGRDSRFSRREGP